MKNDTSKNITTLDSTNPMDYQKCSHFSPDGKIYTVGTSTGQFTIWQWSSLIKLGALEFKREITDISIQGQLAVVTTSKSISTVDLVKSKIRSVLDAPKGVSIPTEFRSALYDYFMVVLAPRKQRNLYS